MTGASLPTLSLITPSFNQARFLGATLASVQAQSYPALEHIVVDGGSTDGSRDLISAHASQLAWWCSERDEGMYAALNKGFARTSGEIMGWLNSDDLLLPGALRAVGEIFARFPDVQWLSSLTLSTWTAEGHCIGTSTVAGYARSAFLSGDYLPGGAKHFGWIPQESTFWRRSLWERAGARVDAGLKAAGDFELWCRFYEHAELIGTPTPLGGFRTHQEQKSRAMDDYLREARAALAALQARSPSEPGTARGILARTRLHEVPGLRGPLAQNFGHEGRRVVADPNGGWRMETYRFL